MLGNFFGICESSSLLLWKAALAFFVIFDCHAKELWRSYFAREHSCPVLVDFFIQEVFFMGIWAFFIMHLSEVVTGRLSSLFIKQEPAIVCQNFHVWRLWADLIFGEFPCLFEWHWLKKFIVSRHHSSATYSRYSLRAMTWAAISILLRRLSAAHPSLTCTLPLLAKVWQLWWRCWVPLFLLLVAHNFILFKPCSANSLPYKWCFIFLVLEQ